MPISADPNIPTVAGYVQVVSFHLLTRDGEKVDLKDASYIVTNITELDALLSLEGDPNRDPEDSSTDDEGGLDKEQDAKPKLADSVVLIKHDLNPSKTAYLKWDEFRVKAKGDQQTHVKQPSDTVATTWSKFAYNGKLNPSSSVPCHTGSEFNRKVSFVDFVTPKEEYGVGDVKPSVKIVLNDSQDTALLSTTNELTVTGKTQKVTKNDSSCTLDPEVDQEFKIKGWQFKTSDYPKENPSAPNPRVKLLWLAVFEEN
jgi:hypothetical protein